MQIETIRRWARTRRYQRALRELRSLSAPPLRALGIAPDEADRLAMLAALG